ncbi:MAG: type I 3-dehydroquinate dehydratase [Candidatus Altiarchaeales archaeon WOR_SM1_86-2]|nr:MAG: type I 3-dehydroquinate dehydratase [Candidatus Altiarchaeales archaeon WOR_SM1_86-2]
MICIPVIENNVVLMVEKANAADSDLVELRLDYLDSFENLGAIKNILKPKIATCMPKWEGGNFPGTEDERIEILLDVIDYCDMVTVELNTRKEFLDDVIEKAKDRGVKVIVAYHNFKLTPEKDEILEILRKEKESGADVAKVAFLGKNHLDVLNVLYCLADNDLDIPIIAVSMGELGKITRVMALVFGSYLTYACAEKGKESAPGQLTVEDVKKILKILG